VETVSKPEENARLQVPQEFGLVTIIGMEEAVHVCVRDLVFNLDDERSRDFGEDRKSKKVVVPTAMGSQTIHHGIN
jgi:hypothetical protein